MDKDYQAALASLKHQACIRCEHECMGMGCLIYWSYHTLYNFIEKHDKPAVLRLRDRIKRKLRNILLKLARKLED